MSESIVPHARFLEIRQRRRGAVEELAQHAVARPNGDSLDAQLVTIDDAAVSDEHRATRSALATSGEDSVGRATTGAGPTSSRAFDQTSRGVRDAR
jgi:hypothetical protein